MKASINFAQALTDFYGEPINVPDMSQQPKDGRYPEVPMTLAKACTNALGAGFRDEESLPGDKKQYRWRIGCKIGKSFINKTGEVSMKAEEITEILVCTDKAFPPVISGVIRALLDPSEADEAALVVVPQGE